MTDPRKEPPRRDEEYAGCTGILVAIAITAVAALSAALLWWLFW